MAKYINGVKVDSRIDDLTGKRFGRLVVQYLIGRGLDGKGGPLLWQCVCDCGRQTAVRNHCLKSGHTKSCSCLRDEILKTKPITHGRTGTTEWKRWNNMKDRIKTLGNDPNSAYFGLEIEEEWIESFDSFLEHIGEVPSDFKGKPTLDRIDTSKGYVKGNVRWATFEEQARNRGMWMNNKSGVTGVCLHTSGRYWVANYMLGGQSKSEYFSIKKLGRDGAFKAACEFREKKIAELNEEGAGYTENHGIKRTDYE